VNNLSKSSSDFLKLNTICARHTERLHDFRLPTLWDLYITGKGGEHLFMAEVLAPGFELLRGPACVFAQDTERMPETMRIEARQTGSIECFLEDGTDRVGIAAMPAGKAGDSELTILSQPD
jgi:hypothetical protein